MKPKKITSIITTILCLYGFTASAGDYHLDCEFFTDQGVGIAGEGENGLGYLIGIKFEGYETRETEEDLTLQQMLSDDFTYNEDRGRFEYKGERVSDYISYTFPKLKEDESEKSRYYYQIPKGYMTDKLLFKKDHLHIKYTLTTKKDNDGELSFSVGLDIENKYSDTLKSEYQDFKIKKEGRVSFNLEDTSDLVDEIMSWNISEFSPDGERKREFWNEVAKQTPKYYPEALKASSHSRMYRVPQEMYAYCSAYYY